MTRHTAGTWYPPSLGTGGFLAEIEGQLFTFTNPPFAEMTDADPVNHPPHYTAGPIEVIDILEQAAFAQMTDPDPVNHPPHYTAGPIEVIDILEQAAAVAPNPVLAGLQWQALKYLLRMWLKGNPEQDARKAQWYLSRLISKLEGQP